MNILQKYMQEEDEPTESIDTVDLDDTRHKTIRRIFNDYLKTPRFDGDACVVLTMPESTLKKYKEKINAGLWWMYHKYCQKDFGMMQLLVAIENMIDASKLASMLDMDIKLLIAKESGINASESDIENAANRNSETQQEIDEMMDFQKISQEYIDKLNEDDPEEEAFILAGLSD